MTPFASDRNPYALSRIERREMERSENRRKLQLIDDLNAINDKAQVLAAEIDAMAWLGQRAMTRAAFMSHTEQELTLLTPTAANRVRAIGDLMTLSIAELVNDAGRVIRS